MKKNYGLTNTELQIMELLWSREEPMTFQEIMEYANTEWNKSWKAQTLNTFLLGLKKMGIVRAEKMLPSCNGYSALCTKEQLIHRWARKVIEEYFNNSFSGFVTAFIGEEKLSDKEKEEIREELKKLL